MKVCHIFDRQDTKSIPRIFQYEVIEAYGDWCNGHPLHTWDDGWRKLVRCKACGAFVLIQKSELHSFSDMPDGYYMDYFAVSGPEEAHELNRRCSGSALENDPPHEHIGIQF